MLRVVPLLLARGASVATKDSDGLSPLEVAERRGRTAMVALLRAAGVPTQQSTDGDPRTWGWGCAAPCSLGSV